jgi:hypothetical protein
MLSGGAMNPNIEVEELTVEESHYLFDKACRSKLNMSGQEFINKYDAGYFTDELSKDPCFLFDLEILLPFGRA